MLDLTENGLQIGPISIQLLLEHSKDGQPPTLEIETDGKFAESMNITSPLNAVTSSERLLLPIANETDEEIIVKKNKRVGAINVL